MVNSGQVPGLFDNEEMNNIIMELKNHEKEGNIPDNKEALTNFFLQVDPGCDNQGRLHTSLALGIPVMSHLIGAHQ